MGARIKKHIIIKYRIIYPIMSQKYGAQCSVSFEEQHTPNHTYCVCVGWETFWTTSQQ